MSAGYSYSGAKSIHIPEGETREIEGRELTGPVNVRTGWSLQEASLVPIGADNQAQIGAKSRGFRSLDDARAAMSRNIEETPNTPDALTGGDGGAHDPAPAKEDDDRAENAKNKPTTTKKPEMKTNEDDGAAVEDAIASGVKAGLEASEKRVDSIMAIGERVGDANWAISELRSGRTVEEVQSAAIDKLKDSTSNVGHKTVGDVGMSKKEERKYSISRAFARLAEGKKVDGLEGEVSAAIGSRSGKSAAGFFVAPEALRANSYTTNTGARDLIVTGAGTGDELVDTDHRSGDFIDVLRPNMVTAQAGVRIISGLVGNADFPRKTTATTASWPGDEVTTAHNEQTPVFDTVSLSPLPLGCFVEASKQVLHQGLPDVDSLLRDDLNQGIAVALDQAVLRGSGSGEPQGIDGASSVPTSTIASAAAPTKAELFEFLEDVDAGNALSNNMSWVTTPVMASYLKQTLIDSGVSGYFWDMATNTVLGHTAYSTAQADTNDLFFGDFSEYLLGIFDGIDITVDPYSLATTRLIRYTVNVFADGDVRRPAAFCTNA